MLFVSSIYCEFWRDTGPKYQMAKTPLKSFKNFSSKNRSHHLSWRSEDISFLRNGRKIDDAAKPKKRKGQLRANRDIKIYEDESNFKKPLGYISAPFDNDESIGYTHKLPDAEHLNQARHKDTFTEGMTAAANAYKSWSPDFNHHLRGTGSHESNYSNGHPLLDEMKQVTSNKTIHPVTVYRGFDHTVPIHKAQVGDVIHDKGFTGTSLDKSVAHSFSKHVLSAHHDDGEKIPYPHAGAWGEKGNRTPKVVAKIHLPPGTKGFHLDIDHGKYYGLESEREFVLHPGTKFHVTGHSKHTDAKGFKYHFIHMTARQDDEHG